MKKFLVYTLTFAMVLGLCSCGEKPGDNTAEPESGEGSSVQEEILQPEEQTGPDLTDEYLVLANKTHPLGEDYYPDDLVTVSRCVSGVGTEETHKLRKVAAQALEELLDAAEAAGLEIRMRTGFRSYSYQKSLFQSYVDKNGEEKANTFSARPGQSEHQSGLCCDLGGKSEGFALSYSFGNTDEGKWVAEHAHEYGFIVRYIDGTSDSPGPITGYVYEPWHVRYVGADNAEKIYNEGITLEEYLNILD